MTEDEFLHENLWNMVCQLSDWHYLSNITALENESAFMFEFIENVENIQKGTLHTIQNLQIFDGNVLETQRSCYIDSYKNVRKTFSTELSLTAHTHTTN